jgi:hypothetical protein
MSWIAVMNGRIVQCRALVMNSQHWQVKEFSPLRG